MNPITKYRNYTHKLGKTLYNRKDVLKLAVSYFIAWIIFEVIAGFLLPIFVTWFTIFRMDSKSISGLSVLVEPRDVFLVCEAFLYARIPDFLTSKKRRLGATRAFLLLLFTIVAAVAFAAAVYAKIDEIMLRGYFTPYATAWWFAIVVALVTTGLISASMALKAYEDEVPESPSIREDVSPEITEPLREAAADSTDD